MYYLLFKIYIYLAKDVLDKTEYDIIIQTFETQLCTFSTLRYSAIRHVCLIWGSHSNLMGNA